MDHSGRRGSSKALDGHRARRRPRTAAVVYFAGTRFERYALPLEQVVDLAHEAGVPVIVDAAAQLPPVENLWHYTGLGADLALFSGGKGPRGPQASGLVLGRRDLVDACRAHACPNHALGRTMKTSKENVLGLVAAVERAAAWSTCTPTSTGPAAGSASPPTGSCPA
ncbi:aminotransferase class V-fold PLP-dependent enzyme [Phytohabitans suffuscus]|uniref:aminotransferase class V-fold PLP-dependent enzyme n=1 Tax=Phytohabitans suffuscus TaxID=624315 RepID=UPI0022B29F4B|nr:aminotransferase class V-fold PLP-dependent enzyme [Phytohabitans suffuscus]